MYNKSFSRCDRKPWEWDHEGRKKFDSAMKKAEHNAYDGFMILTLAWTRSEDGRTHLVTAKEGIYFQSKNISHQRNRYVQTMCNAFLDQYELTTGESPHRLYHTDLQMIPIYTNVE